MKKLVIVGIIVLCFSFYLLRDFVYYGQYYSTSYEAVKNQKDEKVDEVVEILEDKSYALGLYRTNFDIGSTYLYKKEKGWKILYSQIWFFQHSKFIDNYKIAWYKHNGNYLICINNLTPETNKEILQPKDSLQSEFKHYSENNEIIKATFSYWFLVLNDLPENYTITIGDKSVQIK